MPCPPSEVIVFCEVLPPVDIMRKCIFTDDLFIVFLMLIGVD